MKFDGEILKKLNNFCPLEPISVYEIPPGEIFYIESDGRILHILDRFKQKAPQFEQNVAGKHQKLMTFCEMYTKNLTTFSCIAIEGGFVPFLVQVDGKRAEEQPRVAEAHHILNDMMFCVPKVYGYRNVKDFTNEGCPLPEKYLVSMFFHTVIDYQWFYTNAFDAR